MRANKRFIFTIAIIGIWTYLTYFIVIRNQSDFHYGKNFRDKIANLETELEKESKNREQIISQYNNLIQIISIKTTTSSVASVVIHENNLQLEDGISNNNNINKIQINNKIDFNGKYINDDVNFPVIPVIVFACNRISVSRSLDALIKYRPSREQFPIIVSQDCGDEATREVIMSYKDEVQLIQQPDMSEPEVPPKDKKFKGYYKISRHYNWALNTTFQYGYDFVIIVEDDLDIAPDFYEYFLGTFPLLRADTSLWCISAWNDNGKEGLIDDSASDLLYRSDFFPGLGWMMSKELWNELGPKWPRSFWDDWIRNPEQRNNRVCIRPELPRTRTFGKVGVSNGLFFEKHLKYIKLSEKFVQFSKKDLNYLLKENYDKTFMKEVYQTPIVTFDELRRGIINSKGPVRIQYNNRNQFKLASKSLGIMDDFKSGVPRTAYNGIVSSFYNNQRVFLAPGTSWKGYDPSWS